jgi:hypothetical protein
MQRDLGVALDAGHRIDRDRAGGEFRAHSDLPQPKLGCI